MTTYPETTNTRLATLTEAWRALLTDCPLPAPAVVSLEPTVNRITIQAGGRQDPLDHLAELLLWAYTLEQVTARWWHTRDGHLHLTIHGRTTTGVTFKVYGGIPFAHCAGLVPLAPDESEGVSLDEIYTLLGLLRDHHHASAAEVSA
jgi:hypothetical protein